MRVYAIAVVWFCSIACHQPNNERDAAQSPTRVINDGCEDCELLFEGLPANASSVDTLPDFHTNSSRLIVEGTVYKPDGKTPAQDVIVYIYHTDHTGRYTQADNQTLGRRHGRNRGWATTNRLGEYRFYTVRPSAYPGGTDPAHIHITIKESHTNPYYIDDVVFTDDTLVTERYKADRQNRGGSGICTPVAGNDSIQRCKRDIVLGMNIPNG